MGYTNKDFINAFLTYHRLKTIPTNEETATQDETLDIAPLLPFILNDTGYDYYVNFIKKSNPRFELNKCRHAMIKAYTRFNRELFDAFKDYDRKHDTGEVHEKMTDAFIEKMDVFIASLNNDLRVVQVQVMNALPVGTPFQTQQIVSASMMFNHMAKCAQDLWGAMYHNRKGQELQHPALNDLMRYTQQYAEICMKQCNMANACVDERKSHNLQQAVQILYRKIVDWVVKDMNL